MSSTRKLSSRLTQLLELFNRNDDWLIVINADPDAMASAMALKRIMSHRTGKVTIARINEISRPDNLAMIRYLRIPMLPLTDKLKASYSHFAMVDSQPHHNPAFAGIPFSIVIDHHPAVPEHPVDAAYVDIRPQYGAVSTLLTEYLRAYHIRPGIRLATALQYGIRTDTATFTRTGTEIDLRGMRGDEALMQVQYFIDDAILAGASQVRILHGKGNGILRQMIRQYLATVPNVRSFRDEHVHFGGAGITVVEL